MSYDCPQCDSTGFASVHSLRGHTNASDDHDDWSTVSEEISHPSDSDGGDESKRYQRGAEAGEKSPSDEKEDAGEDMDVETALDKQRSNGDDVSETGEGGAEASEKTGSAGIPIPVKSSTLVVGVLGLVVVAVIYSRVSGAGDSNNSVDTDTTDSSTETTDDDPVTGGVVVSRE